ncbi:MAG TPA: hypothetical protein VLT87_10880 [Thermoanaerobaculia bacterium]|nr:hypothetical protein [Thermoanaerobaculia bacterium]
MITKVLAADLVRELLGKMAAESSPPKFPVMVGVPGFLIEQCRIELERQMDLPDPEACHRLVQFYDAKAGLLPEGE